MSKNSDVEGSLEEVPEETPQAHDNKSGGEKFSSRVGGFLWGTIAIPCIFVFNMVCVFPLWTLGDSWLLPLNGPSFSDGTESKEFKQGRNVGIATLAGVAIGVVAAVAFPPLGLAIAAGAVIGAAVSFVASSIAVSISSSSERKSYIPPKRHNLPEHEMTRVSGKDILKQQVQQQSRAPQFIMGPQSAAPAPTPSSHKGPATIGAKRNNKRGV